MAETTYDKLQRYTSELTPNQDSLVESVRLRITDLEQYLIVIAKDCRERSLALTKLDEALFWAKASLTLPKGEKPQETAPPQGGTQ